MDGQGGAGGSESAKPISMRGRKKHKCSVCGNSAKSRCPFYSCKGCCVKAKNACHIHVLKSSSGSETVQGLSALSSPHPAVATSVVRQHHPNDNLRLRTFKPLGIMTKKEAFFINHLRFKKLKTFTEGIIETEDQAFDRYMQNMALLEAIFPGDIQCLKGLSPEGHLLIEGVSAASEKPINGGLDSTSLTAGLQLRLCSSSKRKDAHRQKLRRAIERTLQKLNKGDQENGMLENEDLYTAFSEIRRDMKRIKVQSTDGKERVRKMDVFTSITEKVKQMESQEDFNSCLKLFGDTYVCRDTFMNNSIPKVAEVSHAQELGTESKQTACGSGQEDSRDAIKLSTFYDGRVDSCGVLKSWWKVDLTLDPYVDIPTAVLQAL